MVKVTRWWWIRHAPVTSHKGKIYGQEDVSCDCNDHELFKSVARKLPENAICITSDLKRTKQTADALETAGLTFNSRIEENSFREQNFGDWQGVSYADFDTLTHEIAHRYWLAPATERAPNGESFIDVLARTGPAITKFSAQYEDQDIIAVTHGGPIRAAITLATGIGPEKALSFTVENLSITRLDHIQTDETTHWRIGFINWLP